MCKGSGFIDKRLCHECDGRGFRTIDKQVYYRQLRREQKDRLEVKK